jgi:hypothetical protein
MDFNNWESLCAAAQTKLQNVLKTDAAPVAKEIFENHIISDVYEAYTPRPGAWPPSGEQSTYARRFSLFADYAEVEGDALTVTSRAAASPPVVKGAVFHNRYPGAFLQMLESGKTGIWKRGFPRPAVTTAPREIDRSAKLKRAITAGIQREFN